MDETIKEELIRLKEKFHRQKEKLTSIAALAGRPIDRDFPIDLWEFSDKEIDTEMADHLTLLNDHIDTRPGRDTITSHRPLLGPFIVFFKRLFLKLTGPYTNMLLDKQKRFNQALVHFQLASFIRQRRIDKKIEELKKGISDLEETLNRLETGMRARISRSLKSKKKKKNGK